MHFNSGYRDECIPLVARFTDAFAGYDAVTPSPSCASMVRHYTPPWPGWPRTADASWA